MLAVMCVNPSVTVADMCYLLPSTQCKQQVTQQSVGSRASEISLPNYLNKNHETFPFH